jgi:hypothetical protein
MQFRQCLRGMWQGQFTIALNQSLGSELFLVQE